MFSSRLNASALQAFKAVQSVRHPHETHRLFSCLFKNETLISLENRKTCLTSFSLKSPNHQYGTHQGGLLERLKSAIGLGKFSKSISRTIGYKLYASVEDRIDHEVFFKELKMADTFHSWFIIKSLHVWMLMVRLMNEGENGRLIRNAVVEALWEDVDVKSKQLGETASSVRRKQIQNLVDEFQGNLFAYDEGLQSSDKVLAGAIWRNLLLRREFDARHLEILVDYVRENVYNLDQTSFENLLEDCEVNWIKIRF